MNSKLVRDNIIAIIEHKGGNPTSHIATESEYWMKLKEKLGEEVQEFQLSEEKEELADILEVIHAICEVKQITFEEIEEIRINKGNERGTFTKKIILDS